MSPLSPSVSLLVRTKNRSFSLKEALTSIAEQSYRPIEVVVVNDGGEEVEPLVAECLTKSGVEWHYHAIPAPGKGRSAAANVAMEKATGNFWLFLDDDDLILPTHISNLVDRLTAAPQNILGVYSSVQCLSKQTAPNAESTEEKSKENVFAFDFDATRLAFKNYLPIHAVLFRSEAYTQGCRFDESLDLYEDWHFWLQVIQYGDLQHLDKITALYRTHLSGVGAPGTNKDYNSELISFFKAAIPFWQEKHWLYLYTQESHYFNLLNSYDQAQEAVDQAQEALKQLQSSYQAQKQQLVEKDSTIDFLRRQSNRRIIKLYDFLYVKACSIKNKLLRLGALSKRFWALLLSGQFRSVYEKTRHQFINTGRKCFRTFNSAKPNTTPPKIDYQSHFYIVSTHHTRYIAELIRYSLKRLGFDNITLLPPENQTFTTDYHFVICPQMFNHLPTYYFAFQMEQSVSSRWFTKSYFKTLDNAIAIMDYSLKNIQFLQEKGHFPYQRLFYTPVSNIPKKMFFPVHDTENQDPEYDVVFYGDANAPRRKTFLDEIGKRFKLLVVSEVFGDALYHELSRAKVVVNIHYYENALLETTRIYECLSLGLNVISETSSDQNEHAALDEYVAFTPINDVETMCQAITSALLQPETPKPILSPDINHFTYFLGRMLLALDLIPRTDAIHLPSPIRCQDCQGRIGLSLPETYQRHDYLKTSQPDTTIFPGLRHTKGWIGCALSYQYMARQALACGIKQLESCEDDVILSDDFTQNLDHVYQFLNHKLGSENWDIFCAIIADVNPNAAVSGVFDYQGLQFVVLDYMTSAVFNIYNRRALELLAQWDASNEDVQINTIDRYLENESMVVVTCLPFLVGHHEEQNSTLWGATNKIYSKMIQESEARLKEKVSKYLQDHSIVVIQDEQTPP